MVIGELDVLKPPDGNLPLDVLIRSVRLELRLIVWFGFINRMEGILRESTLGGTKSVVPLSNQNPGFVGIGRHKQRKLHNPCMRNHIASTMLVYGFSMRGCVEVPGCVRSEELDCWKKLFGVVKRCIPSQYIISFHIVYE
ncbi:hypothetical protein SLE2022_250880 [Rubroshorea leprosula]